MTFFPRGNHLEIECLRLDLYNVFSFPIPSMCLMGSVFYYYLHHLTFSYLAKHFLVLLSEQEPPSKNIKPWTTRSSLNIKPSKSRAGLGRAGHSSVWPRSFSLWSNGFFLSLIWWVIFFIFYFYFLTWILGGCWGRFGWMFCIGWSMFVFYTCWNFIFSVWMNKLSLWVLIYKSSF